MPSKRILIGASAILFAWQVFAQPYPQHADTEPSWTVQGSSGTIQESDPSIEKARAQSFNDRHGRMRALDQQGTTGRLSGVGPVFIERVASDPLPVNQSDAIVTASVSGFKSFFSTDHTTIYTELYLQSDNLMKALASQRSRETQFVVLKRGGAVEENGRTFKALRAQDGSEPLDINTRYVLFLKYEPSVDAYDVLDGWRINEQNPVPLIYAQRTQVRTDNDLLRYTQLPIEQFLDVIQEKINRNGSSAAN